MMLPAGQYNLLYVDPPWKYEMYSEKGEAKSPQSHYPCMSLDELKSMRDDVVFATGHNAACVMWTTFAFLDQALDLMSTWGFKYKTGGSWIKRAGNGNPTIATGYVLRSSAELFLIGTHGAPRIKNKGQRNLLLTGEWPSRVEEIDSVIVDSLRREHSRKPDEMISLIEGLFEGPYLEMFSRQTRPGWTCWGDDTARFRSHAAEVPAKEINRMTTRRLGRT